MAMVTNTLGNLGEVSPTGRAHIRMPAARNISVNLRMANSTDGAPLSTAMVTNTSVNLGNAARERRKC